MSLKTAGPAAKIKLTAARQMMKADGQDLIYVNVELTDLNGLIQPNAENRLIFDLDGFGKILAVDNANLKDVDPYVSDNRKAWKGRAMVIIRSSRTDGKITLKVSGMQLEPDQIVLKATKLD